MKRKSLPTGRDFLFVEGYGNENPGAFQSPRPLRGATNKLPAGLQVGDISTHAPLAGRDDCLDGSAFGLLHFNPRAPCGARHIALVVHRVLHRISIHAPLAGRDEFIESLVMEIDRISTHAPLAGRDQDGVIYDSWNSEFQPTRPLRGATM